MIRLGIRKNSFLTSFLVAILTAVFLRFLVLGIYKVPTTSMLPNLYVGDVILAWKLPYNSIGSALSTLLKTEWSEIKRGEVIVFKHPQNSSLYVKRVVAVAGDKIQIREGALYINDKPFSYDSLGEIGGFSGHEHFQVSREYTDSLSWKLLLLKNQQQVDFAEVFVPERHIFVMGDNRNSSDDSRDWGAVPIENVEAKVVLSLISFHWKKESGEDLLRWDRVYKSIE